MSLLWPLILALTRKSNLIWFPQKHRILFDLVFFPKGTSNINFLINFAAFVRSKESAHFSNFSIFFSPD